MKDCNEGWRGGLWCLNDELWCSAPKPSVERVLGVYPLVADNGLSVSLHGTRERAELANLGDRTSAVDVMCLDVFKSGDRSRLHELHTVSWGGIATVNYLQQNTLRVMGSARRQFLGFLLTCGLAAAGIANTLYS